jgi:ABC-type polysaccharide/polyol phosphate transport system ATPase subunit
MRGDAVTAPRVLLQLEGVTKDYPKIATGGDRLRTLAALMLRRSDMPHFRALDGVSLEVRRGESVGVIGENGAGKSTLLKLIAGVIRPSRGTLTREGTVGALLELGSGFHPDYTGRENIYLAGAVLGLSRAEMRGRLDAIVEFADIGPFIDEPIRHYSSGMVVRLGFAVATSLRPDILITDEVLAVGDESFQKKCVQWMEGYLAGGGTLLLCSHSMFHIQTLCRKALWLDHGKARLFGDAFEVTREYLTYHEEKRRTLKGTERAVSNLVPRVAELWTEAGDGARATRFASGAELVVQAEVFEPDDRPPVLLVGIVRADGTPVYGTHSNENGFSPRRIAPTRFGFALRYKSLGLLPGKYALRAHALDPEGLRMCDTVEADFVVSGETRDYGLVRLEHEWQPGRGDERPA